jgi:hypothetical protein
MGKYSKLKEKILAGGSDCNDSDGTALFPTWL